MHTIYDVVDKYRSISVERVNDFLTRKCIGHQCTELRKIEFKLEDWSWDLYIDDNYFKMELVFPITEDTGSDKPINKRVAEEACIEVTRQVKVLKAYYCSYEYVNKDNENKLVKYNILLFNFGSYCYNMYDFSKLFYDGLNIILWGYKEYHKLYNEIESKLPITSIGYIRSDNDDANEKSRTKNRHHIGFV